jgi:hypothetical protein
MSRNDTYRLDLPDTGMLGSILLRITGTCASGASLTTEKWRLIDHLSDLQIMLNASHPCKDLTGYQAQAINWFDQKVMPDTKWNQYAAAAQVEYILINFGRKLMDPGMGLDLSMFDNVQLRLTNVATSTYYADDLAISTLAYFKEEGGGFPLGYIKSEQFKTWSATLSTWEYTDLPTEGKLRRLILQLEPDLGATYNEFETSMDNMGASIKITFNSGAVIFYEGGIDDLMREINLLKGTDCMVRQIVYRTQNYAQRNGLGRVFACAPGPLEIAADTVQDSTLTFDSDYDRGTWAFANAQGTTDQFAIGWGTCPHACLEIPFIDSEDPADWIDLAQRKTMKVDIQPSSSSGATGGASAIVIERQVF